MGLARLFEVSHRNVWHHFPACQLGKIGRTLLEMMAKQPTNCSLKEQRPLLNLQFYILLKLQYFGQNYRIKIELWNYIVD